MSAASLDPRVRVGLAGVAVLCAALQPRHRVDRLSMMLLLEATACALLTFTDSFRGRTLARVVVGGAAAIACFALTACFRPGHALWTLAPGIAVSAEGLAAALGHFLSGLCAVTAVSLVAATTRRADVERSLLFFRVPPRAVAAASLLAHQAGEMSAALERSERAARARGLGPRGKLGFLAARGRVAALFLDSVERGASLDRALAARGFDGRMPRAPLPPLAARDAAVGILGTFLLLTVSWIPIE